MNLDFERPDDRGSQTIPPSEFIEYDMAPSGVCIDREAVSGVLPYCYNQLMNSSLIADKIDMEFNTAMYSSSIKKKDGGLISKFKRYLFG